MKAPSKITTYALAIGLLTGLLYARSVGFGFTHYDDNAYIYEHPVVTTGLNTHSLAWLLTQTHVSNYHPVTSLTNLIDVELYGLNAQGHHLTNVLIHCLNAMGLFLLLVRITGRTDRSLCIALLFALHPWNVESVAWISSRKNLTSFFFMVATLWFYVGYVRAGRKRDYLISGLCFGLGLLSKSILVVLPLLMMLLDYWPLDRRMTRRRVWIEKAPFLALAVLFGVVTLFAQQSAMVTTEESNLGLRAGNAVIALCTYLLKTFWPVGLTPIYPFHSEINPLQAFACLAFLVAATLVILAWRQKKPWALVGWFWFGLALGPVIGIIRVGNQAYADRYMYIPIVGLGILLAWCLPLPRMKWLAVLFLSAMALLSSQQIQRWGDSVTLFRHTLRHTKDNLTALSNLGQVLLSRKKYDEAAEYLDRAVQLKPDYADGHMFLGKALALGGDFQAGMRHLRRAAEIRPDHPQVYFEIGFVFYSQRRFDEAIQAFSRVTTESELYAQTQDAIGACLSLSGRLEAAIPYFQDAISSDPELDQARLNLANAYLELDRIDAALEQFTHLTLDRPEFVPAILGLARAYREKGDYAASERLLKRLVILRPMDQEIRRMLQEVQRLQQG